MTKTFKEFRAEKSALKPTQEYPVMETSFGEHSLKKTQTYPVMGTSFGQHSLPKKKIDEATKKLHIEAEPSVEQHQHAHTSAAPMPENKLSSNETDSVKEYTDESRGINGMLHKHAKGYDISTGSNVDNKKIVKHLDAALRRQSTTEDMHVYTGLKSSPSKYFKDRKSTAPIVVHLPAFTSTSTSPKTAQGFSEGTSDLRDEDHGIDDGGGSHFLKIHLPKGTKAGSVKGHSFVPEENEILLHRGHNIEIDHKPTKMANDSYMWHAKIVSHKPVDIE